MLYTTLCAPSHNTVPKGSESAVSFPSSLELKPEISAPAFVCVVC